MANNERKISVSVIIPCYNGGKFVAEAINSVIKQSLPPECIIVVNDGSVDDTESVVLDLRDRSAIEIKYVKQENKGLSAARNAGLAVAKGDWVAFLDADDIWYENKLEEQLKVINASNFAKLGLIYGRYTLINQRGEAISNLPIVYPNPKNRGHMFRRLLAGNFISGSGSAALVKKEIFGNIGSFDEGLGACEDWDMWLRIAQKYDVDYADADLVQIRLHEDNMQRDSSRMFANELKFFRKWTRMLDEKKLRYPATWGVAIMSRMLSSVDARAPMDLFKKYFIETERKKLFWFACGSVAVARVMVITYKFLMNLRNSAAHPPA